MSSLQDLTKCILQLMREERWLDAIQQLKSERAIVEKDWRLSWNFGWCYFKLEKYQQAQKHLTQAVELAPENAICLWGLGSVYLAKKQFRKAEKHLVESLRIKDGYHTRISLALAYLAQGKVAEAENIHLESIRLRPKESRRYESYACFLSDVGREIEAQEMNERAEKLRGII